MERRLGRRVALGNLKLRLLPPHLQTDHLAIFEDSNFGTGSPFLKAEDADLSIGLFPLLRNRIEIGTIELKHPTIEVVKNTTGVWNFTSLGYGIKQPQGTATDVGLKGNLILHDGQVAVTNLQKKTDRKIYDHIDLKIEGLAPGKPFSIDLMARTQGGQRVSMQGKVGPLSEIALDRTPIDGTLKLKRVELDGLRSFLDAPVLAKTDGFITGKTDIKTEKAKLDASGSFDLENLRVNGLEIGQPMAVQYNAEADPVARVVTIGSSTVRLGKAPASVTGSINLQQTPAELNLRVNSENAPVQEVTRLASAFGIAFAPGTSFSGQIDTDLQIQGPADNPAMNGKVDARDLVIKEKTVQRPVEIASVNLAITPAEMRSNNFELRSGNTTAVAHFNVANYTSKSPSIDFALKSSNANLTDVLAMARTYGGTGLSGINGAGTLSLDVSAAGAVPSLRSSEVLRLLNGTASVNLQNVHLAGLDIEHEVIGLGKFKKRVENTGRTDIAHLTGNFVLRKGIAQTNDLRADLRFGNLAAAGAADLVAHTLNLRATAIISTAVAKEFGGGPVAGMLSPVLTNSRGELVVPGIVTGTFEHPRFAADMDQFSMMHLKGVLPTSDNPFGLLGNLFGSGKQNTAKPSSPGNPSKGFGGVNKVLGKILGGK
jgi:uncharacterized protein involved in outer membrane biogenesis